MANYKMYKMKKIIALSSLYSLMNDNFTDKIIKVNKKLHSDYFRKFKEILNIARKTYDKYNIYNDAHINSHNSECISDDHIKCIFCGNLFNNIEIANHIRSELELNEKVTRIVFDKAFGLTLNEVFLTVHTVKQLKREIYNRFNISMSKLAVYVDDKLADNNDNILQKTVFIKLKN